MINRAFAQNCNFPHDVYSLADTNIQLLVGDLGAEGYGIFWAVVELLYRKEDGAIEEADLKALSRQLNIDFQKLLKAVDMMVGYNLLIRNGDGAICSKRVAETLQKKVAEREAYIARARMGGMASGMARNAKKQAQASPSIQSDNETNYKFDSNRTTSSNETNYKFDSNRTTSSAKTKLKLNINKESKDISSSKDSEILCDSIPPSNFPQGKGNPRKSETDSFLTEDELAGLAPEPIREAFRGYVRSRGKMRKPVGTESNAKLLLKWLEENCSSDEERIACLNNSAMSGYQGLFPVRRAKAGDGKHGKAPDVTDGYRLGDGIVVTG